jgi:hypothetical protein
LVPEALLGARKAGPVISREEAVWTQELIGAIMLIVASVIIFVLRPRQGVPVDFISQSSGNFQALVGLVVVSLVFIGVGMIITGLL